MKNLDLTWVLWGGRRNTTEEKESNNMTTNNIDTHASFDDEGEDIVDNSPNTENENEEYNGGEWTSEQLLTLMLIEEFETLVIEEEDQNHDARANIEVPEDYAKREQVGINSENIITNVERAELLNVSIDVENKEVLQVVNYAERAELLNVSLDVVNAEVPEV